MNKLTALLPVLFTIFVACSEPTENPVEPESSSSNKNQSSTTAHSKPPEVYAGGAATTLDNSPIAFSIKVNGLSGEEQTSFFVGNSLFNKNWVQAPASTTARDGLGPFFNTMSCSACHFKDGRGRPPETGEQPVGLLFRLSIPGKGPHGGPVGDPIYGGQLSPKAITGVDPEGSVEITYEELPGKYADGTPFSLRKPTYKLLPGKWGDFAPNLLVSPRVANQVFGMGLLEIIPEADLLDAADPEDEDKDGVSGRVNRVWDVVNQTEAIGRIGWKANQPHLVQQTAGAFQGDIGITSAQFPKENHTPSTGLDSLPSGGGGGAHADGHELDQRALAQTVFYMRTLAVPAKRNWDHPQFETGRQAFEKASCHLCHTPTQKTGPSEIDALNKQTFYPYTDLLLHDMGEELADNRPDFTATGKEWRTPPLWGIGLFETVNGHQYLLHDGRARGVAEAILWHGGEGKSSAETFKKMSQQERNALVFFVNSL